MANTKDITKESKASGFKVTGGDKKVDYCQDRVTVSRGNLPSGVRWA